MIDAAELVDNEFLRQFELRVNDDLAKIEYSLQERKIFLTKLIVPETVNNEGFIEDFLRCHVFCRLDEFEYYEIPTA